MIHPRLFELQMQHEKEERERRLRKRMALREASAPAPGQPIRPRTGLSGRWQFVQERLRLYWASAVQTPLFIHKGVQQDAPEQQ